MIFRRVTGDKRVVPVVMFHSVGAEQLDWIFNYISEPLQEFEAKIRTLKEEGFNFITWPELYAYMRGELSLKLPSILLTFDDGYLDNWVNVYPILKKYDARGTIFVSSDFIDPSTECRLTLDDVHAGLCQYEDLDISGFLNWPELKAMEDSGVIDIQSHAATHTWYFKNSKVTGFCSPGDAQYPWMAWNEYPERKPFYMREDQTGLVRPGTPVYEHEKSLVVTRYIPQPLIADEMASFVERQGGEEFFQDTGWETELFSQYNRICQGLNDLGQFESESERRERTINELVRPRKILGEGLSKSVDFICWPGGGYDEMTLEEARVAGYKAWTLGSSDQSSFRNIPGVSPEQVKRIGSSIQQYWKGRPIGYTTGSEFYCGVKRHQGSSYHKWVGRVLKVSRILNLKYSRA